MGRLSALRVAGVVLGLPVSCTAPTQTTLKKGGGAVAVARATSPPRHLPFFLVVSFRAYCRRRLRV